MNSFLRKSGIFAIVFVLANLFFSGSAFAQTITTDQADYPPGGTVTISGSGFQANETVTLQVLHVDANGDNLSSPTGTHAPWTINADANGDVSSTWLVPLDEDEYGATLLLTADGVTSLLHSQVEFTDAGNVSITTSSTIVESFTGYTSPSVGTAVSESSPASWTLSGVGSTGINWQGSAQATGTAGGWYANANLSFLGSGNASAGNATWLLKNDTGVTITGFTLSFVARMWKSGTASPVVSVSWSNSATITNPTAGALANNLSSLTFSDATTNISTGATLTQTVTGLSIAPGQYIFIRFIHPGGSNSDNLGWDDVSFTPTLAAAPTAGIYESYAIMNFGGSDVYYDLSATTGNTDFNGANFGTKNSSEALYLGGAQIKTFKCSSPSDVSAGTLFYRIYPTGTPNAFGSGVNLPFLSNDGATGCGGQNQTWQKADAGVNLLIGLCDGNYTIELYTTATINTGTATANNGGANYKATFTVKNSDKSGIVESYLVLNSKGIGNAFYDLNAATANPDFAGSNLGSFCTNETLVIAGAQNKIFKCTPNNITGNSLKYRVYSGSPSGTLQSVNLPWATDDAGAGVGCQNQTWQNLTNTTNIISGLSAGTYTLEVHTEAAYESNGICPSSHIGANYTATFTVLAPVTFITKPAATVSANTAASLCTAVVNYNFVTSGSTPITTTYTFSGATTASGPGTGSGSTFNKGTTLVTVTASNACSPNAVYSFNVVVTDATAPTVITQNATVNLDVSGNANVTASQINNGSTDDCGIASISVSPSTFNCSNILPVMNDLIISEYVEGSSNIKYLEIYNGTSSVVNLGDYTLRNYANGAASETSSSALPTANLASGSVVVYKNSSATGYSGIATSLGVMTFNGNDVVALFNNVTGQFADIIGQIGNNPGTEWGTGLASTADNTLRRKLTVTSGDVNGTDAFVPANEWDGFATDNTSGLGAHGNTVVLTVTDTNGNSSTGIASVMVKDNMAPTIPTLNDVTVGECNGTPTAPTTTDNCKGTVTGTTSTVFPITTQGTTVVTWIFNDGNGNSTAANQNVVVKDITAPVANLASLPTITGQCSATIASDPTATDNCSGTIIGTTSDALTRSTQGTSTITWIFDDGNGNKSYQTQDIVVADTQAPVADAASLASATGQCSATIASAPTATDNCSGTITGTTTDSLTRSTQVRSTVTWIFDDGNGNKSYQTQDIVVDDTIAPVADVATLPTVTGECSASVTAPKATDACVGSITGTTTDPISYSAQGTYTVTWTYDDGNGNTSSQTQTVIVDDVTAPTTPILADVTGECSATALTATTSDVCVGSIIGTTSDALSYSTQGTYIIHWIFDDGNGNTTTANQNVIIKDVTVPTITAAANVSVANATGACSAEVSLVAPTTGDNCEVQSVANDHPSTTYPVGITTVTWTVTDVGGNTTTATQTVTVINAAPVINSITPSTVSPVAISLGVSVTVNYTDNNVTSGKVNWDDGLGDQTISTSFANSFTLNHTYTTPGVYTVTITLTDACGSSGSSKYDYIVVYDPNGGFVTGGGWINSPTGAYPADALLSGKANFGFVAKYKKGTNLVDGNTEFQFHAGNFNFKFNSTTNDAGTLVISGAKASYRGVGTVNGTGNYGYLVSAIDGQVTGGGGTDKFRIKIWDKNNGNAVVYDNQMSAAENADATTVLGGGSIVIHEAKKTNAKIVDIPAEPIPFNVIAYPNPAKYQFTLVVEGDSKEKVDVMVFDVQGRTVKHIESNDGQPIQFGEELPTGAYFTIVSQGASQKTVRLIKE